EFLYRLLRTVADADIVRELVDEPETIQPEFTNLFELTDSGRMLKSDHSSATRDLVRYVFGSGSGFQLSSPYLPSLIRQGYANGTGLQQAIGSANMFEHLIKPENSELLALFNGRMTADSTQSAHMIGSAVDFARFTTLTDIGGNLGTVLAVILLQHDGIRRGIVFDLKNVIERATKKVPNEFERMVVDNNRYQFMAGDMFDSTTIPSSDAYLLKNILHDWSDSQCIDILKSIRDAANNSTSSLLIVENVIRPSTADQRLDNWRAHALDICMMCAFGGKERTLHQYEYLLKKSGFELKQLHLTAGPMSIIEATRLKS
ncbi:unnamed protein product, partial [Didymodactylos carnosus]